tara:strand:+ start:5977 stop:6441 length:465 start_codon:yes stop_codon:yes gene_type:complete
MERTLLKLSDIAEVFGELKRVAEGGKLVGITYEEMKKFDLDLKFGKIGEDFVKDMQNGNTMIEVKTERDIWKDTGNIAIEVRCNGVPSGISTTGSAVWIHLLSYNNKIEGGFIFSVDDLKDKIRRLLKEEKARLVMGGDFDSSQMVLLPIKELF